MPGTRRTPIGRPPRPQYTPEAIEIFRKLRRARTGSERWWQLHNALCDALPGLRPWDWRCVENPDEPLHPSLRPDPEARQRWRALAAMADRAPPEPPPAAPLWPPLAT